MLYNIQKLKANKYYFRNIMKKMKLTNFAVFILFFGIAFIEAFQKQSWVEAALFFALGVLSLWVDFKRS